MRVLLVEDEPKIATFIQKGLQEEHYAVDVARDGEAALDWAAIAEYDLVILDILLPKRNGFSVCRELRQRGVRTPILMLTAKAAVDDCVSGLDSGADDYLVKPFAFKELLARLRALGRRPPQVQANVLHVADLTLDTVSHQATSAGHPIDLTSKEYRLLEFLMRHPNQVVSRTMIAEHVWNYDFYSQSNIVDVYIRYLRRKIDYGFSPPLIHTVRGVGYKLSEIGDNEAI